MATKKRIESAVSHLTYRKMPFLLFYEIAMVIYLYFSGNPYQRYELFASAWFFVLGLLCLSLLTAFEKDKRLPLPYANALSKYEYLFATAICFLGTLMVVAVFVILVRYGVLLQLNPLDYRNWFTLTWTFQFGIVEEPLKIALTNILGIPTKWIRNKLWKTGWICFVGAIATAAWAIGHVLSGAYVGPFAFSDVLLAFFAGIVFLAVTVWKKNLLPAVLIHGVYNIGQVLGYWA